MRLNDIEVLALVAIARLGDQAYGVSIRDDIGGFAGRDVSMAAVYAALDRLDSQGLVQPRLSDPRPERGGRSRRHYRLTATGRVRLRHDGTAAVRMWTRVLLQLDGQRR